MGCSASRQKNVFGLNVPSTRIATSAPGNFERSPEVFENNIGEAEVGMVIARDCELRGRRADPSKGELSWAIDLVVSSIKLRVVRTNGVSRDHRPYFGGWGQPGLSVCMPDTSRRIGRSFCKVGSTVNGRSSPACADHVEQAHQASEDSYARSYAAGEYVPGLCEQCFRGEGGTDCSRSRGLLWDKVEGRYVYAPRAAHQRRVWTIDLIAIQGMEKL